LKTLLAPVMPSPPFLMFFYLCHEFSSLLGPQHLMKFNQPIGKHGNHIIKFSFVF
jgi:hypothetical protein